MATANDRPAPSPRCAVCGKRFKRGEARIRRGLTAVHVACAERASDTHARREHGR